MAFVSSNFSTFLGARSVSNSLHVCRRNHARISHTRMTLKSPTESGAETPQTVTDSVIVLPPFTSRRIRKGDRFNFVRFAVDDFNASTYFDTLTGAGVRVAVLDTGCDPNHPALVNRIDTKASKNYTEEDGGNPAMWLDRNSHGTHCAGIIAAEQRNAIMYGVAPEATIVVKKVLNDRGGGRLDTIPSVIAQAIRDATAENCKVISMSLGLRESGPFGFQQFSGPMAELYVACQEAMAAGVTIVCAAGNSGLDRFGNVILLNTIEPPGAYGGVITVASHDDSLKRSDFSSFGGELDFMAPGEVISTVPGGGYEAKRGTSMATPLVAGLAALLIEAGSRESFDGLSDALRFDLQRSGYRARNNYEVREMLRFLSDRPNEHRRDDGYGALSKAYRYVNGEVSEDL